MHRNHPLKNCKIKKAPTFSQPTSSATLNVVNFGFRAASENTGIHSSNEERAILESTSLNQENKESPYIHSTY